MHYYFLGVTTGQSAMKRILPAWAELLDLNLQLVGVDMAINSSPSDYIDFALRMKNDPEAVGAVVTTHKLNLYRHARHIFDGLDEISILTGEIGSIAKKEGRLLGYAAVDAMSFSLSLQSMIESRSWQTHEADVLCFGAGGAARSVLLSLFYDVPRDKTLATRKEARPKRISVIDNSQAQLDSINDFVHKLKIEDNLSLIHNDFDPAINDRAVDALRPKSIIVNATGMGKDSPGSPTSDNVCYPDQALVWDLNYRGELLFLSQARRQAEAKRLAIFDGWTCFVHGWTQSIENALALDMAPKFDALERCAARLR